MDPYSIVTINLFLACFLNVSSIDSRLLTLAILSRLIKNLLKASGDVSVFAGLYMNDLLSIAFLFLLAFLSLELIHFSRVNSRLYVTMPVCLSVYL